MLPPNYLAEPATIVDFVKQIESQPLTSNWSIEAWVNDYTAFLAAFLESPVNSRLLSGWHTVVRTHTRDGEWRHITVVHAVAREPGLIGEWFDKHPGLADGLSLYIDGILLATKDNYFHQNVTVKEPSMPKLQIRLHSSAVCDTDKKREEFAKFVSSIMERGDVERVPYQANEGNSHEWIVDMGNDWRVQFDPEDALVVKLWHRYDNIDALNGITSWIVYRHGGVTEPVPERRNG
jgi:hypothetical protein